LFSFVSLWLTVVFVLILLAGFFSAAEIGMMSINRYRLRHLVKAGHRKATLVQNQLNHPEKLLSTVLIGNTLANVLASMGMTFVGQSLYQETGVAIAEIILTIILLVFAEMTPKTWAALHPETVSFSVIHFLRFTQLVFLPLSLFTTYLAQKLLTLVGVSQEKVAREKLSYEELRAVVNEADSMLLPKEHQGMLVRLLDLERAQVEDVMIPKSEIVGIDVTESWVDILEQLMTIQHTRIPLYKHHIEDLVGVVHIRDVAQLSLNEDLNLEELIKIAEKPIFIPAATPLNMQIVQFREKKCRSGFIVNEYGDMMGLVTLEDILEEVVGEFTTDVNDLFQEVIAQGNDEYLIDASISLKQLNRMLGWSLPLMGPRTLSGLLIEYLGYIPPADCSLKLGDYQITILRVTGQMIKSVRIKKIGELETDMAS
jgi:Mg2+/Co2+ transporter CorB